jgi:hypothetical protein
MKAFLITLLILTLIGPLWILVSGQIDWSADWRTANRESAEIAPAPENTKEAVIQAYTARAFNWRGLFASHNWIAVKPKNATQYIVYQVVGWRKFWNLPPLMHEKDIPDRYWFGQKPLLILDIRGDEAEALIPEIESAAKAYPYAKAYELWPGPNSNTFPAFIARAVPKLGLALPSDAIGKDFLPGFTFFAKAPSGTGYQFSLFGVLGILLAKKEGVEINILGFVYGIRFSPLSIELPGVGPIPNHGHSIKKK